MHDSPRENQSLPPTPGLSTPTSVPVELDLTLAVEQIPRGAGTSGIGNDEMRGVFKPSAAQLMSMVPARKHPGPRIRKHLPLVIPKIPSTPSNASNYTLSTPRNPSTPLLPSAMLPSPITPSFDSGIAEVIQPMNNTSGSSLTPEISPDRTSVDFSLSPDISLASLWSFDSSQPPTRRKDEMWINLADPNFSHSQKPLRTAKMSDSERLERAMKAIEDLHYSSVAEFFSSYIQQIPPGSSAKFSERHCRSLKSFLQGENRIKPINIVEQLYCHRYSYPSYKSTHQEERELFFHPYSPPTSIKYARISISAWATQLVGKRVVKSIRDLTHDPRVPDSFSAQVPVRLAATANDRTKAKGIRTVTKEDLMSFRLADRAKLFEERAPLVWYLTACMAAPKKNGVFVVRKRRNPSIIQAAAISSFVLSRNQYANGYMAIHMGIWHIATGSHVDVKRAYSHLAGSVHETTARQALETMAETSLENLRAEVREGEKRYQVLYRFVLDNIQEFLRVWEGGIGLENRMICGCACTAIGLEDCTEDAFDFVDRFLRILKNERAGLTVEKLYQSINWTHIRGVQSLHVLRALFSFVPSLEPMEKLVSDLFRTDFAIHRMREGRKTKVIPLGCNSEKEIKTAGMLRAIHDFLSQAGVSPVQASRLISWFGGDGGSVLAMDTAKKYLATMYDPEDPESDYKNLHNILPTIGIWHTQSTMQNTIAANHYGPLVTADPSALSRSAACAGFKRPTNFKDCGNYYPLSRSMTAIWETQILDCWRIELGLDHYEKINPYFDALAATSQLPTFEWFREKGEQIVDRYLTPEAYEQALSKSFNDSAPDNLKFPVGEPYSSSTLSHSQPSATDDPTTENCDADVEDADAEEDEPATQPKSAKEKKPTSHIEEKGFTGDRVLANSILFKMEYSWWIEAAYAIPDGDIGRVWEIMKIWIFIAAGGSNTNYVHLLLEMYCLFTYESKKDLKDAIWNNWLVNVTVISPNVEFFLRLKEELENSLELYKRSKSHTSCHLCSEYKQLLTLWGEESLDFFRTERSMGHAAIPLFNSGSKKLAKGLLDTHLGRHTDRVEVLQAMENIRQATTISSSPSPSPNPDLSRSPSPNSNPSRYPSPIPIDPPSSPNPASSQYSSPDPDTSSPSGTSDEETSGEEEDEADETETNLLEAKNLSRLAPGPELMSSIDPSSGRLIYEWDSDVEEMLEREGNSNDEASDEDTNGASELEEDSSGE